ncbi:hypothetical protein SESBI_21426 [Sesbania bispinosa]|nr:hypothetical protein SESBI_21426 [Sesbania bispinosa]
MQERINWKIPHLCQLAFNVKLKYWTLNQTLHQIVNSRLPFIEKVGWDGKLVNQSYPWVEKQIVHRPKFSAWQRAATDSLLDVGVSPFNGFTYDHKYGTKVGGTIFDRFGRRHTSAELLASANPDKLTVLIYATVQKIVFDTTGKRPKAMGVIFKDEHGKQHRAILGNDRQSEDLNIPVVLDNQFVGKGMADNPMNTIFIPSKRPVQQSLIETVGVTNLGVYIETSCGYGQSNDSIHCHHGLLSAEIGQLSTIPPKQRSPEAVQAFVKSKKDIPIEAFRGGFILSKVANPWSTGELKLRVVDGSTFTESPGTNPQATVMMMGRYHGTEDFKRKVGVNLLVFKDKWCNMKIISRKMKRKKKV